ncbi:hypothetical protein PGIGA_G00180980, partial [Pangasianodon gigas]|nr:hypothetical protein [Pangasianodon gigas]
AYLPTCLSHTITEHSSLKTSGPVERPSPLCFLLCGGATSYRHNTNKADSYTRNRCVDACVCVCVCVCVRHMPL